MHSLGGDDDDGRQQSAPVILSNVTCMIELPKGCPKLTNKSYSLQQTNRQLQHTNRPIRGCSKSRRVKKMN